MSDHHRGALWAYEAVRERFLRDGWTVRKAAPNEPYDFFAAKGDILEIGVETSFVQGKAKRALSQAQYPPDDSWAFGILWQPEDDGPEEILLIPGSAWKEPSGALSAPSNGGSRWGPTYCVALSPRHRDELRRFSLTREKIPVLGTSLAEEKTQLLTLLDFARARADRPEERELRAPQFFPDSVLRPGRVKELFNRRVNALLLEQFVKYCKEKGTNPVAAVEAYMAFLLGVDCPDSPYLTDAIKVELEQRRRRGDRLPSYWTDRSIRPDLSNETKAKPSAKKR